MPAGLTQPVIPGDSLATARLAAGELIFTSSASRRVELGNSSFQYTIGQTIDELAEANVPTVALLPGTSSDFQHNLNQLDYTAMGLSQNQQAELLSAAYTQYNVLQTLLNQTREEYLGLQTLIATDQKTLNEVNKAISAVQAANISGALATTLAQLESQALLLTNRIAVNVAAANSASDLADDLLAQTRSLAEVVQ